MNNVVQLKVEERVCSKCGESRALSGFQKRSLNNYRTECRQCTSVINKKRREQYCSTPEGRTAYLDKKKQEYQAIRGSRPDGRQTVALIENGAGRICIKCNTGKLWDEFAKDMHGYNQKTADCKECRNIKFRHEYNNNPNIKRGEIKNRPARLMRLYGITWDHVVQTLANQFGRCANHGCSKEISLDVKGVQKNRAVIDHCHTTGKFRAVLCVDCNCLLGKLETKSVKVLGLMDYINKYR